MKMEQMENNINYKTMSDSEIKNIIRTIFSNSYIEPYSYYFTPAAMEALDNAIKEEVERFNNNIKIKARRHSHNHITNNVYPVGPEGLKAYLDKHTTRPTYDPTKIRELVNKHFNKK